METVTPDAPVLQSQPPRSPLVPILALITILSISASAFLYYQSLGLQKQLAQIQSTVSAPTPTPTIDPMANWKTYAKIDFEFKLPVSWIEKTNDSSGKDFIFSSGLPGRSELVISKLTHQEGSKVISDPINYFSFNQTPRERTIKLGTINAKEYFGCVGVEGCMDMYELIIDTQGQVYVIGFTTYPDQEKELYQTILSTFKFTN